MPVSLSSLEVLPMFLDGEVVAMLCLVSPSLNGGANKHLDAVKRGSVGKKRSPVTWPEHFLMAEAFANIPLIIINHHRSGFV